MFRRCFARPNYHASFLGLAFSSLDPSRKRNISERKKRERVVGTSLFVSLLSGSASIFQAHPNSSVKTGSFVGEASLNRTFSLIIGLLRKGHLITSAGQKKKRDVFSDRLSSASNPCLLFLGKTNETTGNIVYSVSAQKTKFVAAFSKIDCFRCSN